MNAGKLTHSLSAKKCYSKFLPNWMINMIMGEGEI